MEELADAHAAAGITFAWSGLSLEEIEAGGSRSSSSASACCSST